MEFQISVKSKSTNLTKLNMFNMKKLERKTLRNVKGGAILPGGPEACGDWCFGIWRPCEAEHLACPDGGNDIYPIGYPVK
ncbi:Bacteriocin [Elizabethkingia occulta]|uniref:Bacteriocin n=2 Tax=Elizabethkingia occulta TaxID=1867263 RepID=A0A1T3MNT1_9FLAO|nr:hypothetical protein BB020_14565 [Elizabethkingia occulta]OPC66196.1 hypothetical protein BAZ10_02930 [Elizabethkingia occulta]